MDTLTRILVGSMFAIIAIGAIGMTIAIASPQPKTAKTVDRFEEEAIVERMIERDEDELCSAHPSQCR